MPVITETSVTLTVDEYNRLITQLRRDAGIIDFCRGSYMNSLLHTQFGDFDASEEYMNTMRLLNEFDE